MTLCLLRATKSENHRVEHILTIGEKRRHSNNKKKTIGKNRVEPEMLHEQTKKRANSRYDS